MSNNVKALLSWLFGPLGGIVFLVTEKTNKLIRLHAAQSIVTFALYFIVSIVLNYVNIFGLGRILQLLYSVISIIGMIKAYNSEMYRFPVIADIADKLLLKGSDAEDSSTQEETVKKVVVEDEQPVEAEQTEDDETFSI